MLDPNIAPQPSTTPDRHKIPPHVAAMVVLGAVGFKAELGPNAPGRNPEITDVNTRPEVGREYPDGDPTR